MVFICCIWHISGAYTDCRFSVVIVSITIIVITTFATITTNHNAMVANVTLVLILRVLIPDLNVSYLYLHTQQGF